MVYIMISLRSWDGFKLGQWRCFLEIFLTEHAILLFAVNADIGQIFSLSPPSSYWSFSTLGTSGGTLTPHRDCCGCPRRLCTSDCRQFWDQPLPSKHHQRVGHQQEALGRADSFTSERLMWLSHIRYNLCYRKMLWLAATPGRLVS